MKELITVDFDLAAIVDVIDVRRLGLTTTIGHIPIYMLCSVLINPSMIPRGPKV
jgi:hypothetical protein